MDAQHFLSRIESAGFTLALHGDSDLAVTPASRLTDPQRQFIRQHKPEIIQALRRSPADDDILVHPKRYEIIEFTEWRLPSGRRMAFKLAIPREKYDGFELIRLLEQMEISP